jgi:tripartite-type tricarboxylate transporter receptor subunit TctC
MRATRRAILAAPLATPALAQDGFPNRPIRLVVPFPPGGSTDVVGRLVAAGLQQHLGQSVIVENRAGAQGGLASAALSRGVPDGYTLLLTNGSSQGILPALAPQAAPYDPVAGFTHIGLAGLYWGSLLVNPAFPARTLAEFIAEAKRRPGQINYATSGSGSSPHMFVELLKIEAGIDIVHVSYRGSGPALTAVLANEVPAMGDSLPSATPHIRSGALRPLGVSSAARVPAFPDVPTFAEQGFPRLAVDSWFGVAGPPGMAPAVTARIAQALEATMSDTALAERMAGMGFEAKPMSGEPFKDMVARLYALWAETVRVSGVKPE